MPMRRSRSLHPTWPSRLRVRPPSSLRARLALWYILVVGLTLACFGAVILVVVGAYLGDARDTTLRERAALVAARVRPTAVGVRLGDDAFPIERGTAAYLFDARGRLVGRVVGPRAVPPQPGVRAALAVGRGGFRTDGKARVYVDILRDGRGQIRGVIQVVQVTDATVAGFQPVLQVGGISSWLSLCCSRSARPRASSWPGGRWGRSTVSRARRRPSGPAICKGG